MKDVIEEMYYGQVNEIERPIMDLETEKEMEARYDALDKLYKSFSEEQRALYEEWDKREGEFLSRSRVYAYKRGLKMGFWIGLQMQDFDI